MLPIAKVVNHPHGYQDVYLSTPGVETVWFGEKLFYDFRITPSGQVQFFSRRRCSRETAQVVRQSVAAFNAAQKGTTP